jgi:hypothetical protein
MEGKEPTGKNVGVTESGQRVGNSQPIVWDINDFMACVCREGLSTEHILTLLGYKK